MSSPVSEAPQCIPLLAPFVLHHAPENCRFTRPFKYLLHSLPKISHFLSAFVLVVRDVVLCNGFARIIPRRRLVQYLTDVKICVYAFSFLSAASLSESIEKNSQKTHY